MKKIMAALVMTAGVTLIGAQPASAVNADGSFELVAATGKCVEVIPTNGSFYAEGNRIQQRTCDGSPQQQWFKIELPFNGLRASSPEVAPRSGATISGVPLVHLVNRMTLQCLDDTDGRTTNRNPMQQWTCNGDASMAWDIDPIFNGNSLGVQVINAKSGKCLDVADGSLQDGARLQQYNCFDPQGNVAQHYKML